jgi:hypothetical protein
MKRLKRALLSAGFVVASTLGNPRQAERMLLRLTQGEFELENEQENKQWQAWDELERKWSRPFWIGKPRPTIAVLMRENLNKEVLRRKAINESKT